MKTLVILLSALSIIGCTGSVQVSTLPQTITAPPDSGYGTLYGQDVPFVLNPDCDSIRVAQEVLERTLKDIYGQIDGYLLDIDLTLESSRGKDSTIGGLKRTVENLRAKVNAFIREQAKPVPVPQEIIDKHNAALKRIAELEANQERHTWRDWVAAGIVGAIVLAVIALLKKFI